MKLPFIEKMAQERMTWRRFELLETDPEVICELEKTLRRAKLSRYELALIVKSLRVRPELGLEDFRT